MQLTMPADEQAEFEVLGKMLNSQHAANIALEQLDVMDFHNPRHALYFTALKQMSEENISLTEEVLFHKVKKEKGNNAEELSYIMSMSKMYSTAGEDVLYFCNAVKKHSKYRSLIHQCLEVAKSASTKDKTPEELQSVLLDFVDLVFGNKSAVEIFHLKEMSRAKLWDDKQRTLFEYIEHKQEQARLGLKTITGFSTGFKQLDEMIDGVNKGHYIIIAARSGSGKSTLMSNFIHNIMRSGCKIFVQSMEMKATELTEKLVCIAAGVASKKIKDGSLSPADFNAIAQAAGTFDSSSVLIDETDGITISQFCAKVRRLVKSEGIQMVFLDYLTRISGDRRYPSREEEVQYISKRICQLAKTLQIPIICLAQLNRQNEIAGRPPRKSDLRESGQIEADAHAIMMIHRPSEFDKTKPLDLTELHLVKNRFGPSGKVDFRFDYLTDRYTEIPPLNQFIQQTRSSYNDEA